MISPELVKIARNIDFDSDSNFTLRLMFGVACVERVEGLLTDILVVNAFSIGKSFVLGDCDYRDLKEAGIRASALARSHPGSGSIDGACNAAVSASHGVASALAGRALDAAGYSAYASVYSYSSHAVTDVSAYNSEHEWQVRELISLSKHGSNSNNSDRVGIESLKSC